MNTKIASFAVVFALLLASCGDIENTTTTSTDSINADTQPTMSAEPASSPSLDSSSAMAATGMSDQDFVTRASSMNIAEISAHKSAQTKAASADVKAHAKHMLTDHQKMGDEMKALASQKGLTVASDAPADKKQMIDDMNASKTGKDWDMAYVESQVRDHEEAIALFESGSTSVKDADLKALIDKTLPTLRSHLQMVKDAQAKLNK